MPTRSSCPTAAAGASTEQPSLDGIGAARRAEILALFPELVTEEGAEAFAPARRVIDRDEALSIFPLSRRPA
ncbi:MAG: hypothetical protein ACE368_08665 [Paracoccaceae bacterium]